MKILAGNVFTKKLLSKIDKQAYQYGGLDIDGQIIKKTSINLNAKTTIILPEKYIVGDIEKFKSEFEKTLNSWYYDLKII